MHCTFAYQEPIVHLLHQLKFGGNTFAAPALAELMIDQLAARERPDVIIPVPLHWTRLWRRGFNQAHELAIPLGRSLDVPVATTLCIRHKRTRTQSSLDYRSRKPNVRHAFTASQHVRGKRIALLDDVVTTGATIAAASHALNAQGCDHIEVWACARVLGKRQ